MNLFLYFGLVNCLFIPLAIYYLWLQNDKFSFIKVPISYAGTTHTKYLFVLFTLTGVLFELLFAIHLLNNIQKLSDEILLSLLTTGFAGIFITGITPQGKRRLHRTGIRIMIISMTIWSFYLHYLLIAISHTIAYIGFALSIITLMGVPYFFFYFKSKGLTELFFVAIVLSWNILMTIFLVKNFAL